MARFAIPITETGPLLTLADSGYELVLAPEFGARIVALSRAGRDILRPASAATLSRPRVYEFAGFPLMPYSGPIFGDGFAFAGAWHPLVRNVAEEPSATHGEGWIRPWRILSQTQASVELAVDYKPEPRSFPFTWHGRLAFTVSAGGLDVGLTLTCRDYRPMPAGIGFHPYFPKPPGTRLKFSATGVWPPDAPEAVGLGCGPLEPGLDFSDGPDASGIILDRCFEGWDGKAEVIWPDGARAVLTAEGALTRLQIYDAWDYPYLCVEPVSNANDGFNRMAQNVPCHGVAVLEPGRCLQGRFRIALA